MKLLKHLASFCLLASAASLCAQAPAACQWLTSGTAARVLGGEAQLVAKADSNWLGSCTFTRQQGTVVRSLTITVGPTDAHPCPANSTPVKALGNQATQCESAHAATIAGRIRDAYFVITVANVPGVTQTLYADAKPPDPYRASLLLIVAEQVVGNLY
jgi:hypothetical protein